MTFDKENFMDGGEWSARRISEYIQNNIYNTEEVICFLMGEWEFEDKVKDLEKKHEHEKKELYEKYGREFIS